MHQHQEVQVSLILKGNGTLVIGDSVHSYNPGQLFLIGSNVPHVFLSDQAFREKSHMISLFFTHTIFKDSFLKSAHPKILNSFIAKTEEGCKISHTDSKIIEIFSSLQAPYNIENYICLLQLINYFEETATTPLTAFNYPRKISDTDGKRMQLIFDYVLNNFKNEISLPHIANLAYMTPNAFCRYFKQRTNKTFFQFLIELRIEEASKLLTTQADLSIAEISERSGFKNLSNFNRKFKQIKKITPFLFRKSSLHNRLI